MKKRASGRVSFSIDTKQKNDIQAKISPPLFDWVIENLLKNALDAMEGKGAIHLVMHESNTNIIIDVVIQQVSLLDIRNVFNPVHNEKRGLGRGLASRNAIIENT